MIMGRNAEMWRDYRKTWLTRDIPMIMGRNVEMWRDYRKTCGSVEIYGIIWLKARLEDGLELHGHEKH